MKRRVINCFYEDCHGGIGDFLRGSLYLYKFCKDRKLDFFISFKHHGISDFIKTKQEFEYKEKQIIDVHKISSKSSFVQLGSAKSLYERIRKETNDTVMSPNGKTSVFIYTNYSNLFLINEKDIMPSLNHTENLTLDCCNWFKENIIFSKKVNDKAQENLKSLNLQNKNFNIVHFRIGDERSFFDLEYSSRKIDFDSLYLTCKQKIEKDNTPILLLSDNNKLKKYIVERAKEENIPIFSSHFSSQHTQKKPNLHAEKETKTSNQGDFNVALDMKLVTMSKKVDSYSVYFWGSGFITWISKIYNIPFKSSGI